MIDAAVVLLDWFGVAVFAVTGSLAASRKRMDIVGFVLLGTATGIGGGTIRDAVLGATPVFWVNSPGYLLACVVMSVAVFFLAHVPQSREALLLRFDAVGLALFTVLGADKALAIGAGPIPAVAMGLVTATFGGIVRDVLSGEIPAILSREIYATAALAGAMAFVLLNGTVVPRETAIVAGFVLTLAIRFGALRWSWSLPRYGQSSDL
ncbi:trimeric intracellular cation channel family protein [Aliihoeflea sp. 2WW]|uniref:trimeric intracellular cation channel family protein n=1 Tax=Aliihoeflea sp. 2WW TaxID=1381123 RepID=UPI000464BC47|nr:trimeric intracellular cation channel family protein [Aliihoeflea sp. 2WW]